MSESSPNTRLARNSVFMSIRMVIVLIISLYTTRVVLRVLGVEDYGVYNVVAGFVSMFAFLNNALSSATQRYYNFELGKNGINGAQIVYCTSLIIHLLLSILVVSLTEPIGLWYLHHKMVLPGGRMHAAEFIFHSSVLSLFISILTTPFTAAVMAHEKMDFYALLGILDAVLKLIMVFVLPFMPGDKLICYGVFYLLITLSNSSLYFAYCKHKFEEIRLGIKIPRSMVTGMLSFSGWNIFGSIAYVLREQGVNLVLNAFFGTIVNAARGVANQVNGALQGFISSLSTPTRPQVIQSYAHGNLDRAWNLTFSVSKLTCLFFFMVSLPICLEIDFILHIWLGDDIPDHTQLFIVLLLFTNTFGTWVSPISTIMHATGKMKFYQILSSVSNLMTVPLTYIFLMVGSIPEYAYLALFITTVTNLFAGLISARKYAGLKFRIYFKSVLRPSLIAIFFSIPITLLPFVFLNPGPFRFILVLLFSTIVVSTISYSVALNNTERQLLRRLFQSIRSGTIA